MTRYLGEPDYQHGTEDKTGVLLANLGTPDAPDAASVRRYLAQFLWDPRVIEVARPLWWLILHGVILRIRPRKSAEAYAKVWTEEGSPLLSISRRQHRAFQQLLAERVGSEVPVALGMRYGSPSIASALAELREHGVRRLLVLPLYPQYSATTTASVFDAIAADLQRTRWLPELRFINQYHDERGYIEALAASIREHWQDQGRAERLLFSFHGLPHRYLLSGDPYHCHCHKTARLLAAELGLDDDAWMLSFQSRVGREEWLRPYTDETVARLARDGVRSLDVACPGFSADCLETLEEIAMQNGEIFEEAGGEALRYVPALNDRSDHISFLVDLTQRHCQGWPGPADGEERSKDRELGAQRALALGAKR